MRPAEVIPWFVQKAAAADGPDALRRDFRTAIAAFGYHTFCYAMVSAVQPERSTDPMVLMDYPAVWQARYADAGHVLHDRIALDAPGATAPFTWTDARRRVVTDRQAQVFDEAGEVGLRDGLVVTIHAPPEAWVVSLAGGEPVESLTDRSSAILLCHHFHACYQDLIARGRAENLSMPPALTPQEYDCLSWVAHGKTSSEAAIILGISKRTVDFHLANATRKLGAVTRTQAAAIAAAAGLISL